VENVHEIWKIHHELSGKPWISMAFSLRFTAEEIFLPRNLGVSQWVVLNQVSLIG
jgi:hypothetical protein